MTNINESNIYTDLMRKFRDEGHNVYVVTPQERRYKIGTHLEEQEGVNSLSVKTLNIQKTNVLEKGISTILVESQFKAAIKKHLKGVKFDLILYTTPPITFPNVIKYLKKHNPDAKTYLMLKDIFPQNAVDLGMFGKGSIFYKYFRKKEVDLYKLSDFIGCMSPANVRFIEEHNDFVEPKTVELCPNSLELKVCTSGKDIGLLNKYNLPADKTLFIYGGNLGKPQGIDFFIECLDAMGERKDIHFVIAGDGTEYPKIKAWIDRTKPKNCTLFQRLPKEDYQILVSSCDVGLILLDYRFTIPNYPSRLLDYQMFKLPILAATDPNCDIGSIACKEGFGVWCLSNNVNAFKNCVDSLMNCDLKVMGEKSYQYLLKNYLPENTYRVIMNHFNVIV